MAVCLIKKGGGGIQSEDVTVLRSEILAGKTALTADSNDEVVQGTMPLLTSNSDLLNVMLAYQRTDQFGMGKFIDSPSVGRGLIVALRPEDSKKYAIDNRTAFVFIPLSDLKSENIRADKNIGQVQGGIPIWDVSKSGYLDMLYAWADQGHAIDHPQAGRGVVVRVPNGHIIEGANWVFLAEPDLIGPNIRQGVNAFGIPGEMVDYGAGGVAFNGATFDNRLISGVAEKGKEIYMSNVVATGNITVNMQDFSNMSDGLFNYLGIQDGGLKFSVSDTNQQHSNKPAIAVFFNRSINLAPFKKVRVGAKFLSGQYKKYSLTNDRAVAEFGIVFVNINNLTLINAARYQYQTLLNSTYKGRHISFADGAEGVGNVEHGRLTGQQLWAEIDVSDVNEHCFLMAYARASAGYYTAQAECVINYIEFIN